MPRRNISTFTPSPMYPAAVAHRDAIASAVELAGAKLRAIPGVGAGRMGLTPDSVKASPEYREAKRAYDHLFGVLRDFNSTFVAAFKREIAADRAARRVTR